LWSFTPIEVWLYFVAIVGIVFAVAMVTNVAVWGSLFWLGAKVFERFDRRRTLKEKKKKT